MKKSTNIQVGDIVICTHPTAKKDLYEVISVYEFILFVKRGGREFNTTATFFRLATENEIKEAHLKSIFNKKF